MPDDQDRAAATGGPCRRGQVVHQRPRPVLPVADPGRGLGQRLVRLLPGLPASGFLAPPYLKAQGKCRPQVVAERMPVGGRDPRLARRAECRDHRAAGDLLVTA